MVQIKIGHNQLHIISFLWGSEGGGKGGGLGPCVCVCVCERERDE